MSRIPDLLWRLAFLLLMCFGLALGPDLTLCAQQVTVGTPFNGVQNQFFENFGVGWNFGIPTANPAAGGRGVVGLGPNGPQQGINFGFGGPGVAAPPFGLGQPFNGGQLSWQGQHNGNRFGFQLFAEQGSSTNLVSQTPMVTTMNGYPGYFSATTQRPFVIGLIPVVGDNGAGWTGPAVVYPSMSIPWPGANGASSPSVSVVRERYERMQAEHQAVARGAAPRPQPLVVADKADAPVAGHSSAERAAPSLAEIRQQQAEEQANEIALVEELLDQSAAAYLAQDYVAARRYLTQINQRGTPEQQARMLRGLELLSAKTK